MEEEKDLELEHMQDCYEIANQLYIENKHEDALEVIKDSGLDTKYHDLLADIKLKYLMALGKETLAQECFAENRLELVNEFLKGRKFKDALAEINNSGLDLNLHPKLFVARDFCLKVLGEMGLVEQCLAQVNNLYKRRNFESALAVINDSGFNLDVHLKLWEKKVRCLKALNRDKEAYEGANSLWRNGYKMPPKLIQILGEGLIQNGKEEVAFKIYKSLSMDHRITINEREFYLKLMKEINQTI